MRFRIVNKINGDDLVFGATKIFVKNFIAFYSLNGTDTIFHSYGAGPNPNPEQDSLIFVNFYYRKKETVFIRLSSSDTDTLKLIYQIVNASPCCDDYTQATPNGYNNSNLENASGGLYLIKK